MALDPNKVAWIVVHCSYTPPSMDIGVKDIDRWHRERGWLMVGYHAVIKRNGSVEQGRPLNMIGAHVEGFNSQSIGVCLVGGMKEGTTKKPVDETNFTDEQYVSLEATLRSLKTMFPNATIVGHRDLNPHKTCPTFDAKEWAASRNI